jgi:hypothetical protein
MINFQRYFIRNLAQFWVNAHTKVYPSQLQNQVTKSADWRPLFSRKFPNDSDTREAGLPSNKQQRRPAIGRVRRWPSQTVLHEMEENCEVNEINNLKRDWKKIKVFFKKFLMTKWNRHAGQVFREILTKRPKETWRPHQTTWKNYWKRTK